MNYTKTEYSFTSADGINNIKYYIYTPEKKAKALVQIIHGMCEYSQKYEKFIDFLCGKGYAVIANDHLGHGGSVSSDSDLGYFGLESGWIYLIKDVRKTAVRGKSLFGRIPHYFIGHSMGSLILRCYMAKYSSDMDGAVILGTTNRHPALPIAVAAADYSITMHGVKSRSKYIYDLLFGFADARVEDKRTAFDWLTRDEDYVAEYIADKKCKFIFTNAGFRDLFMLQSYATDYSWYKKVRKDVPVLIMSGTDDPIGGYGKGPMQLYRGMNAHGFTDVEVRLFDGARHELLHETNALEVFDEIADWLGDKCCCDD